LEPDCPEDLAFYDADVSVWLGSISHEKDAWIEGRTITQMEIQKRVHGLMLDSIDGDK